MHSSIGRAKRDGLSGTYKSGQGDVRVTKHGVGYQVRWDFPTGEQWIGVGMVEGNVFAAAWGADRSVGISMFNIKEGEKGPTLVGRWAQYRDTNTRPEEWIFVSK